MSLCPATPDSSSGKKRATPPVDIAVLEELREILGDEMRELLDGFLEDAARLLAEAREALEMDALDRLMALSHQMKSSSASVGALPLSDIMRRIERACAEGTDIEHELLAEAESEFAVVAKRFDELC